VSAQLIDAINGGSAELQSLLFMWLISEPANPEDFRAVADVLLKAGQRKMTHLVVSRGLSEFPEDERLALLALQLRLLRAPAVA
jgi:hypothetical protein